MLSARKTFKYSDVDRLKVKRRKNKPYKQYSEENWDGYVNIR